jgi:hypothetical protein
MTVEPAVAITATSGSCPPETDPLTGRPVRLVCRISGLPPTIVVDLRKGDDRVALNDSVGLISGAQASGGAGNDTIQFTIRGIPATLNGDDGNDQLIASDRLSQSGSPGVTFDGGTGTDTAVFGTTRATTVNGLESIGVTASLETNSAVFSGLSTSLQQTTFATDTLVAIEGLTGTEVGDILTGSSKADTIAGAVATTTSRAPTETTAFKAATVSTTWSAARAATRSTEGSTSTRSRRAAAATRS